MTEFPEQWKRYDDNYFVSDLGRVKRVHRNGKETYLTEQKRRPNDKSVRVKMYGKYVTVKRIVWETFKDKIPDGYCVAHKNGCFTMNDIYNLELIPIKQGIALNS